MATYIVKSGDTLGKIARKLYGDSALYTRIVRANHIANPDRLSVGQRLEIPDASPPPATPAAALSPAAPVPPPRPAVPAAPTISPLESLNERRLSPLHPVVADKARELLRQCANDGFALLVTQGLRTYPEQDALYAQGRTKRPIGKDYVVTNARGGYSWHNFGLAFDVALLDAAGKQDWNYRHPGWQHLGVVGKTLGLSWGGDWTRLKDYPHFEYTRDLTLKSCRDLYAQGLDQIWSNVA